MNGGDAIVRSRDQERETVSVPVLVTWLIFYAIAVVGALTAPRRASDVPEMASVVDSTREPHVNRGKAAWK
jgi:hypothetical protein